MKRFVHKLSFLLIIILIIVIVSFITLKILVKKVSPTIMEYSKSQMKKVASTLINKAITNDILEEMNLEELFIVDKSNNEEIINIMIDPSIINKAASRATDAVEDGLKRIELKDKTVLDDFNINENYFYVPIGVLFNSPFLNNIGPKIPINLKMVGNVTSGIVSEVEEYGINNSLITISLEISVEIKVILPLISDYVSITNYVPLAIKLIQGKVPVYYGGSSNGMVLDNQKGSNN